MVHPKPRPPYSRRAVLGGLTVGAAGAFASWAGPLARTVAAASTPVASPVADVGADALIALVDAAMSQYHLKAAIARVVVDG